MTAGATTQATRIVKATSFLLLVAGIGLGIAIFLAPYNTIADEEVYLDQYFSAMTDEALGWNIRSFFYPFLLLPTRLVAESLGVGNPILLGDIARATNYAVGLLGLYWAYRLVERLWGRTEAVMSVALLVATSSWLILGRHFMMDMPSMTWLLGACAITALGIDRVSRAAWVIILGSLSVFTKFQAAPAVLGVGLWAIASAASSDRRWKLLGAAVLALAAMIALFGVVDWLSYGTPYSSLVNFVSYNFFAPEAFAAKYGACEPPHMYLAAIPRVYSWIVPPLFVLGVVFSLKNRPRALGLLLVLGLHVLILTAYCHKQDRYLAQVTPVVIAFSAYGLTEAVRFVDRVLDSRLLASIFGIGVLLAAWLSLLPRNEIRSSLATEEACSAFVYGLVVEGQLPRDGRIGMAVPCGMPYAFLRGSSFTELDDGYNEETHKLERKKIAGLLDSNGFAYMISRKDSGIDKLVRERWGDQAEILAVSARGHYHLVAHRLGGAIK